MSAASRWPQRLTLAWAVVVAAAFDALSDPITASVATVTGLVAAAIWWIYVIQADRTRS